MRASAAVGLLLTGLVLGCQGRAPPPAARTAPGSEPDGPIQLAGLHNVLQLSDKLYSGGVPEGEEGFRSLVGLGVRTVISVDGARPDVETARKLGLRYVHLPIGYDGVPRDRALQLARAVRDLPGPVYVHCHHGQHRSPAAAVAVQLCLDERYGVEQAEALLKRAGTDPHYTGLVSLPRSLVRPTAAELDRAVADFPEVAVIPDLARLMVDIDTRSDHLKAMAAAGWRPPPKHPDLDPAHEARMLWEQYREAARLGLSGQPAELREWFATAEGRAAELERLLRPDRGTLDSAGLDTVFRQVRADCTNCHAKYRDVPRTAAGALR